jgi:hypothetical protein
MKFILFFSFFLLTLITQAQVYTTKIYNCSQLKKGFYKNYKEFINNSPSVIKDFTVIPLSKKEDTIITRFDYRLKDTAQNTAETNADDSLPRIKHCWGFCDGNTAYVDYSPSIFTKKFWKIIFIEKYPFALLYHRDIVAGGPMPFQLVTVAVSATAPMEYDIMMINEKGKFENPDGPILLDIISSHPGLLKIYQDKFGKDPKKMYKYSQSHVYDEKLKIVKEYLMKLAVSKK